MSGISFPSDGSTQIISSITPVGTYNPIINSNSLASSLALKQDLLTASTSLLGVGSAISALDYNKITINKPTTFNPDLTNIYTKTETNNLLNAKDAVLTFNSPLTRSTNSISFNESSITTLTNFYNKTDINNITGLNNYYTKTYINNNLQPILTNTTTLLGIGSNLTLLDYNNISINKPSVFPADLTNVYTKTETNNLLNAKENSLTFNSPLTRNTNTISFSESSITNLTNFYNRTQTDTLLNAKQNTLTASTTLLGIGSNLTLINYNNLSNLPNLSIYATISNLNLKENGLTFNSPLTRTTNTIGIDLSSYLTTANASTTYQPKINTYTLSPSGTATFSAGTLSFDLSAYQTSASLGTTYLKLDGTNNMTGVLNLTGLSSGNNPLYISSTNTTANNCIQIKNNSTFQGYIGIGGTAFGGNYANNLFIESASSSIILNTNGRTSTSTPNMTIHSTGNVGIGINNPTQIFQIGNAGRLRISNGTTDYSLLGTLDTDGATNTRIVVSGNTRSGSFAGNIEYISTSTGSHIFYTTNSGTERMRILNNGNVCIGTTTDKQKMTIQSATPAMIRVQTDTDTTNQVSGIEFGIPAFTSVLCAKITSTTEGGNANDLKFFTNATSGTASTERLRITKDGFVNIGNANNINCRLYVNSAIITAGTCFPLRICAGASADTNTNATILGLGSEANGWSKAGIAHVRTGTYDQGDIVFLNMNTGNSIDCSLAYERMRIYSGGGVNINQGLTIGGVLNIPVGTWHKSSDNIERTYYENNGTSFFHSGNGQYIFRDSANSGNNFIINNNASININNNGTLNFDNNLNDFKINLWGGVYGLGIQGSTLLYTTDGIHRFMKGTLERFKIDANGSCTATGYINADRMYTKNFAQPIMNAYTGFLTGNPTTLNIYNKKLPFCMFYITVGTTFGIYLGFNIVAGQSFAPSLYYNAGITAYVPYFTAQIADGTVMWLYNAQSGIQVSLVEYWFN